MRLRSEAMCTLLEMVRAATAPPYQAHLAERSTTLSPTSAEIGMKVRSCDLETRREVL